MIKPLVKTHVVGPIQTNSYTVTCPETGRILVIDPGDDYQIIAENLVRVDAVLYTHGHFDHVGGAAGLISLFAPETMIHSADVKMMETAAVHALEWGFTITQPPVVSRELSDGDAVTIGSMNFRVLHTPGHSMGSICLMGHNLLFSGDTLFAGSIGRTDLPGSSPSMMRDTLDRVIIPLSNELTVYPGHGPSTTIAGERRNNPFF